MSKLVIISGCSGGGKSTLLKELSKRGYEVVEEPGRRIIAAEQGSGGEALPWNNLEAFARRAIEMSLRDIRRFANSGDWVFFDRGLVDAASALSSVTGEPVTHYLSTEHPYHRTVFLTPPWPEIYTTDAERRHQLSDAIEEYERLLSVYPSIGYGVVVLPKTRVEARADYVLDSLASDKP